MRICVFEKFNTIQCGVSENPAIIIDLRNFHVFFLIQCYPISSARALRNTGILNLLLALKNKGKQ